MKKIIISAIIFSMIASFMFAPVKTASAQNGIFDFGPPSSMVSGKVINLNSQQPGQTDSSSNDPASSENNGLKGIMFNNNGKSFMYVFTPGSGKLTLTQYNGSGWEVISVIKTVKGFEKPMSVKTYRYSKWNDYNGIGGAGSSYDVNKQESDDGSVEIYAPDKTYLESVPEVLSILENRMFNDFNTYNSSLTPGPSVTIPQNEKRAVAPVVLKIVSGNFNNYQWQITPAPLEKYINGQTAWFVFKDAGKYTVTVKCDNASGGYSLVSTVIDVQDPPPLTVSIDGPDNNYVYTDKSEYGQSGKTEYGPITEYIYGSGQHSKDWHLELYNDYGTNSNQNQYNWDSIRYQIEHGNGNYTIVKDTPNKIVIKNADGSEQVFERSVVRVTTVTKVTSYFNNVPYKSVVSNGSGTYSYVWGIEPINNSGNASLLLTNVADSTVNFSAIFSDTDTIITGDTPPSNVSVLDTNVNNNQPTNTNNTDTDGYPVAPNGFFPQQYKLTLHVIDLKTGQEGTANKVISFDLPPALQVSIIGPDYLVYSESDSTDRITGVTNFTYTATGKYFVVVNNANLPGDNTPLNVTWSFTSSPNVSVGFSAPNSTSTDVNYFFKTLDSSELPPDFTLNVNIIGSYNRKANITKQVGLISNVVINVSGENNITANNNNGVYTAQEDYIVSTSPSNNIADDFDYHIASVNTLNAVRVDGLVSVIKTNSGFHISFNYNSNNNKIQTNYPYKYDITITALSNGQNIGTTDYYITIDTGESSSSNPGGGSAGGGSNPPPGNYGGI